MENLYVGPTGSGKTTYLLGKFSEIGERCKKTDHMLVFVKNANSVTDWRHRVNLRQIGPLHVYTYFGFIQHEITAYWPWIEAHQHDAVRTLEPTFMNVETAHYLMSRFVDEARREGAFGVINATAQQIAVQLIDSLNHAAMNGLSLEEVQHRFLRWAQSDAEKVTVYTESLRVMRRFRDQCLAARCLDYSLIICLYSDLLQDERYANQLAARFRYLFVDDLEKTVPAAQDLIVKMMERAEETHLTYNPEGGFTSFFGGAPQLAEETFFPLCQIMELNTSYTSSEASRDFARMLAGKIVEGKPLPKGNFLQREIQTDLRGDMLIRVAQEIDRLIDKGVSPGQIAIIAPIIDKVMDFTLTRHFTERGCSLANLTRTKRLLDEPFAQALITLAFLTNPGWKLELNFSSLVQTLSLILKLDPVRSALLADEIFKHQLTLPELDTIGLRPRLGFNHADKYDHFREWVKEKQTEAMELEHFFQVVFGELLAPLAPGEKDILACRQVVESITKFKRVMNRYAPMDDHQLGESFIDMVLKGTLAAEVLFRPPSTDTQIIIATPYTFLFSPYVSQVQYLFWLDVASDHWFQSATKELSNPYILSRQWKESDEWNDTLDQQLRKEQLTHYLQSLLSKCTHGLYIANSYYNSRGWEQEGELLEWLQPEGIMAMESMDGSASGAEPTLV